MIFDRLLNLCDKLCHENEELQNDLQQARNEIKLLNKQIDRHITAVNDLTDIVDTNHKVIDVLEKENIMLRHALNEVINNDSNY